MVVVTSNVSPVRHTNTSIATALITMPWANRKNGTECYRCVAKPISFPYFVFHLQVSTLGSKQGVIEKQTFINHTDCHCVDKVSHARSMAPEPMRQATVISCTCPKLFEKVLQENGECRCDCSSGNYGCDWMKKGKEHFSMDDRK